jgi:hypothetical protein
VIAPLPGLLPLATMLVMLAAVGWGLGLAAALARSSIGGRSPRQAGIPAPIGLCLAALIATGALAGYALVLRAMGWLPY